jgi:hypothetical protein
MSADGAEPIRDSEIDGRWLANAIRTVQTPATFLQWYGIASLLLAVVFIIISLVSPESVLQPVYDRMLENQREQQKAQPGKVPSLPPYRKWAQPYVVSGVLGSALSLACSFVIAVGGVKMRHLHGYGWALIGSLLSIVPCTNSCCCIGSPIGIFALVTLFGSDVRLAFARVGKAGGLEAFIDEIGPRDEPPSRPIRLE